MKTIYDKLSQKYERVSTATADSLVRTYPNRFTFAPKSAFKKQEAE